MKREFKTALEKRRIIPFPEGKGLVSRELKAANEDLAEAHDRFSQGRFKYATIIAYYSMFHAARALLYHEGYREKSHHYLLVAIEALYVAEKKIVPEHARDLRNAMILREEADYHGEFSESGAGSVLHAAERFLEAVNHLLFPPCLRA
jgi:uncharacterized protein (UPF0332 family)